jgi:predicted nuclease with TOPRIM domain
MSQDTETGLAPEAAPVVKSDSPDSLDTAGQSLLEWVRRTTFAADNALETGRKLRAKVEEAEKRIADLETDVGRFVDTAASLEAAESEKLQLRRVLQQKDNEILELRHRHAELVDGLKVLLTVIDARRLVD